MKRLLALFFVAVVLSGVQGVAAQGNAQGYVPYTETIIVDPSVPGWQNTGIVLIDGIPLTISATGEATCDSVADPAIWPDCVNYLGPGGLQGSVAGGFPVYLAPGLPKYSLVGRIDGGTPFVIGTDPLTLMGVGELQVGYNDQQTLFWDNAGQFTVTVSSCRPGNGYGDTNHCHLGAPGQG